MVPMPKGFFLRRLWRVVRILLAVFVLLVVGFLVFRYFELERIKENEAKAVWILAQRITLADVMGENLPPEPNPEENNRTLAGIDANTNGIRDDVELAIHRLHPESARIRAAQLQYARALQFEMEDVTDSITLVAAAQQQGRGSGCIYDTGPSVTLDDPQEVWTEKFRIVENRKNEVWELVFDSDARKDKIEDNARRYMTSYGSSREQDCDIDLATLPD
ncbi:MAG: hypothetical protein A2991_00160 [Candidatus Terrybacteria bacterium RIFCSPLOWO2_01_FULL_58_14]|uniref:Uncharacterized protein n=2 Tax=Candidatus Terryibacteriota TaxID=1817920 RepID=A0A1G2PWU6_9BACT|nr:MAG: hypothetical protein A2682_03685 [Candidatus Terrybacteria bacterium RIFCSPHIGHO2_01_FULL_58_15]OHA52818.1 MAG: hypothetical protein A2991_00160 [Candidatus Terrybacteria bacterium RIFCSPLOWO2_01_FULL_58_14]